jgi:DNA-binding transcriptional MerR regulator
MNMSDFSKLAGLSAHTLRYYEKIGLLKAIQRNPSGHRTYSNKDLEWVKFIIRLKETGMPLEGILQYATFRERGDESISERQQLLEKHRDKLKLQIKKQMNHLKALDQKIDFYKSQNNS